MAKKISNGNVYMATAKEVPQIGKRYYCYKLNSVDGRPKSAACYTSAVKAIECIGNNMYKVNTCNSIYLVNVG